MQMYHATSRTAVPEVIAGKRAKDALEAPSAIQRPTHSSSRSMYRVSPSLTATCLIAESNRVVVS